MALSVCKCGLIWIYTVSGLNFTTKYLASLPAGQITELIQIWHTRFWRRQPIYNTLLIIISSGGQGYYCVCVQCFLDRRRAKEPQAGLVLFPPSNSSPRSAMEPSGITLRIRHFGEGPHRFCFKRKKMDNIVILFPLFWSSFLIPLVLLNVPWFLASIGGGSFPKGQLLSFLTQHQRLEVY